MYVALTADRNYAYSVEHVGPNMFYRIIMFISSYNLCPELKILHKICTMILSEMLSHCKSRLL